MMLLIEHWFWIHSYYLLCVYSMLPVYSYLYFINVDWQKSIVVSYCDGRKSITGNIMNWKYILLQEWKYYFHLSNIGTVLVRLQNNNIIRLHIDFGVLRQNILRYKVSITL